MLRGERGDAQALLGALGALWVRGVEVDWARVFDDARASGRARVVLCLAEREGLGVEDHELRARVGEQRLGLFRRYA